MIQLGAAAMLGIAGSLHCVGMCGPIVIALPRTGANRARFIAGRLAYNLGRSITYAVMGAIFGIVGQSVVLAGWQNALSIAAGLAILGYLLTRWVGRGRWTPEAVLMRWIAPVQRTMAKLLHRSGTGSLLLIGLLNGLLPCGLVYVALAGAAATGTAAGGAAFMFVFGLGTTPLLLAVALAGPSLHATLRGRMQRAIPIALVTLATLFILRGLSLGIPYISPDLDAQLSHGAKPACCAGH